MTRPRGTGSIYKREGSNIWWIKFYQGGIAHRESTGSTSEKRAQRVLTERLGAIATGVQIRPKVERILTSELYEDLKLDYSNNKRKSLSDVEARWKLHLEPFFGNLRAAHVGTDHIGRYIDARLREEAANATINRELAALKRMFKLGQKASPPKVLQMPSISMLKEDNVRTGFLSDAQFDALAAQCASVGLWLRAMLEVGATYGWRAEEVKQLRVRQVDIAALTIRLDPGTTKNDEGRLVTFEKSSALHELLKACVHGKSPDDFVFSRANGKPVRDFRGTWSTVCVKAGVPGLLYHDLRRTAARNLRRAGIAEGVIMAIGGWRTRSVFERYAIVKEGDISDAIKRLESYRREQRENAKDEENGHSSGTVRHVENSPAATDKQQ